MLTMALAGRVVTSWAGDPSAVRSYGVALHPPGRRPGRRRRRRGGAVRHRLGGHRRRRRGPRRDRRPGRTLRREDGARPGHAPRSCSRPDVVRGGRSAGRPGVCRTLDGSGTPGTSGVLIPRCGRRRGVAQLAEQRSPKPQVAGSSPVTPATARHGAGTPEPPDGRIRRSRWCEDERRRGPRTGDGSRPGRRARTWLTNASRSGPGGNARAPRPTVVGSAPGAPSSNGTRRPDVPAARGTRRPRGRRRPPSRSLAARPADPVPARGRRRAAEGHLADPPAAGDLHDRRAGLRVVHGRARVRRWTSCSPRVWCCCSAPSRTTHP